jgi:hypothetical protein
MTSITDPYSLALVADWYYKQGREEAEKERKKQKNRVRKTNKNTVTLTMRVPTELLVRMDSLIERGIFQNRGELLREAIRRLIMEYDRKPERIPG